MLGIPKEIKPGETRVALTPAEVNILTKAKLKVLVETEAGDRKSVV